MPTSFCRFQSRQKHNAHGTEVITVQYRFHPLYGQSLRVQRRVKFPRGEHLFCELPDGTIGAFPSWMADVAKSSAIVIGVPLTSVAALSELRTVLDSLHSNSPCGSAFLIAAQQESTDDAKEDAGCNTDEPAVL